MKTKFFTMLCIAAAFASCSKIEDSSTGGASIPTTIAVSPTIQTRATELEFESGDEIGLSIVMDDTDATEWVDNGRMTFSGSAFSSSTNFYWYEGAYTTSTFYAYYPYAEAMPTSFSVAADQSADKAYTNSDLMMASKEGVTPTFNNISMTFEHMLSRIVVTKVNNITNKSVKSVKIAGTRLGATIDVKEKSVTVDTSSATDAITMPAWSDEDMEYAAIIIPQSVSLEFVVVFSDDSEQSVDANFRAYEIGKQYNAELYVAEGDVSVTVSGAIDEWQDGGDIVTDSEFVEYATYFTYDGVDYNFATIGGITIMTDNLRYVPTGMAVSSDPSDGSGLWYPCRHITTASATDDPTTEDINEQTVYSGTAYAVTDQPELGYLYSLNTALGTTITNSNYNLYSGARGICPKGWHIPTYDDWFALCGQALSASDDATAPFYNAEGDAYGLKYSSIYKSMETDFNFTYTGSVVGSAYNSTVIRHTFTSTASGDRVIRDESLIGLPSLNYYMSSTGRATGTTNPTVWAMMSTYANATTDGKFYLLSSVATTGQSVRCVRDTAL